MWNENRVIIIDGQYLVLRSFFGALNSTYHDDLVSYAWELIIQKIFSLMNHFKTKKIFIVLEGNKRLIEKYKIWPTYKINRKKTLPIEFVKAMRKISLVSRIIGVTVIRKQDQEGDDMIASLTEYFYSKGKEIMIFSQDKDMYQLINPRVRIVNFNLDLLSEESIVERFKLGKISQFLDYQILIGDAVDNLPGVKGIGAKQAVKLLGQFGSIDNILRNINNLNVLVKQKIKSNIRDLFLMKEMMTLNKKVEINPYDSKIFKSKRLVRFFLKKNHCYNLLRKLEIWWDNEDQYELKAS